MQIRVKHEWEVALLLAKGGASYKIRFFEMEATVKRPVSDVWTR